jgi:hypothetical protein
VYDKDGENGTAMPLPRAMMVSEPDDDNGGSSMKFPEITVPVPVPHVRVYQEREHAAERGEDEDDLTLPIPIPRQPSGSTLSMTAASLSPLEIVSPRPRRGLGRESPMKGLEEKLEEVLEPRPGSRVVSRSRGLSTGGSGRPRSRVSSIMDLSSGSWGRKSGNGNGSRVGTPDGSVRNGGGTDEGDGGVENGDGLVQQQQQLRTRVVSISAKSHSHRLSGVEVWGETHPHYHRHHHVKKRHGEEEGGDEHDSVIVVEGEVRGGVVVVKRDEESSEDGEIGNIESVLEKSGVGVEDGVAAVAVMGEPKSSVITVVEGIPSLVEEEESMESLLEKEEEGKKVSGVDAWEMVGQVDTVRRVEGLVRGGGCGGEKGGLDGSSVKDVLPTSTNDDETELERRVRETRKMVEDVRVRLENVEMWIERYEKGEKKNDERRSGGGGMVMRVLRGFSTLFGYHSSLSLTSMGESGRRRRRFGMSVSSCVVLVGIGVCMVLLRVFGRRRVGGGGGGGFGIGRMVGHWVLGNGGGR